MRIEMVCRTCQQSTPFALRRWYVPLSDTGLYNVVCPSGHRTSFILQQMRFEVLGETAVQAIIDGYTREAVSSFAAALERFYEFYVRTVLLSKGILQAQIDRVWAQVKSQSERQLGMFAGIYATEENEPAPLLPNDKGAANAAFRNRVVHQGYIPTEEEAIQFGQKVIDIVEIVLKRMMPRYQSSIEQVIGDHMKAAQASLSANERVEVSNLFQPMVFRLAFNGSVDLREILAQRRAGGARLMAAGSMINHG